MKLLRTRSLTPTSLALAKVREPYLHAHHPDIMSFLDTKRERGREDPHQVALAGCCHSDITFELAKRNQEMYLFSPYDVERVTAFRSPRFR